MLNNKDELFALPVLKQQPGEVGAKFEAQVHFCSHHALEPDECDFLTVSPTRRPLGSERPKCPHHPEKGTSWANIYSVNGQRYRRSY